MKAMVLAAGLGTRLRPLTDDRPKALVELGGRTLLEITLTRLKSFGISDVVVNVHYFADLIVGYLKANDNFGMRVEVSREDVLLDTGGGLKNAGGFFLQDSGSGNEPFVLHNVDVISTIDLHRMVKFHSDHQALATLAVRDRETSRYLLFDDKLQLCGRRSGRDGNSELVRPAEHTHALAFSGVHVISTRLIRMMIEDGIFSIVDCYLRLAGQGKEIVAFRTDEYYWRDLGRMDDLKLAARDLELRLFSAG
jgi:NDP-sugar pyrophosphorylase family protein